MDLEAILMIEIVFSESAGGSLKMAQRFGEGRYQNGAMGIFISHEDGREPTVDELEEAKRELTEKAQSDWEKATPMGGNSSDIYVLGLMLSIGDISENPPGVRRRQTLEHLFNSYPNDEGDLAAREILGRAAEDLSFIHDRGIAGEPLRIWYSNQPDDMCGLYWLMSLFKQWNIREEQIALVELPAWKEGADGHCNRRISWAEVEPQEWRQYLAFQKAAPSGFMEGCADHWEALQAEDRPLRAVLNGQLVSVSDKLYDEFIHREIEAAEECFREAVIIGRVLGKYQLGISDGWIAQRIEVMIAKGLLEVVTQAGKDMPVYHRTLKKLSGFCKCFISGQKSVP